MSADELIKILRDLGLGQSEAARLFGIEPRTMRRYIAGDTRIPGPTAILLRLLKARPELLPLIEKELIC